MTAPRPLSIKAALADLRDTLAMVRTVAKVRMGRHSAPIDRSAPPLLMTVAEAQTMIGANDQAASAWLERSGLVVMQFGARRVHRDRLIAAWFGEASTSACAPESASAPAPIIGEGLTKVAL